MWIFQVICTERFGAEAIQGKKHEALGVLLKTDTETDTDTDTHTDSHTHTFNPCSEDDGS